MIVLLLEYFIGRDLNIDPCPAESRENSVDPDQLAKNPTDLDLLCFSVHCNKCNCVIELAGEQTWLCHINLVSTQQDMGECFTLFSLQLGLLQIRVGVCVCVCRWGDLFFFLYILPDPLASIIGRCTLYTPGCRMKAYK